MASFNRVILMGNLTRDPEYKQLTSGQAVCRLGLASNRSFKNKQSGSMVQEVCYVDVDVWGPQAETCRQYLAKGRPVLVEGRLKFDSWQEPDGAKRSKHSIVADRVTFLAAGAQAEDGGDVAESGADFVPATAGSTEQAEKRAPRPRRAPAAVGAPASMPGGEIALKDEAPFEDDLPF